MLKHSNSLHDECPECPDRLKFTFQHLSEYELLNRCLLIQVNFIYNFINLEYLAFGYRK